MSQHPYFSEVQPGLNGRILLCLFSFSQDSGILYLHEYFDPMSKGLPQQNIKI